MTVQPFLKLPVKLLLRLHQHVFGLPASFVACLTVVAPGGCLLLLLLGGGGFTPGLKCS